MNRTHSLIKLALSTWCVGLLTVFTALPAWAGAVSTTTNPIVDGSGHCLNGKEDPILGVVNCNIYNGKQYVWMSGLPVSADLPAGRYFFAVVEPGGKSSSGPSSVNDCTDTTNLSDVPPCDSSKTGANGDWTHRVFDLAADGTITYPAPGYPGGHDLANNRIRLAGYDDTTNNGGEYQMAVCKLPTNDFAIADATSANPPGVDDSACAKSDNFKINAGAVKLTACKFNDLNASFAWEAGEPFLPNWLIYATGVATDSLAVDNVTGTTGADGCVDFTVSRLSGPVTLEEDTSVPGWIQTAAYAVACSNATCAVDGNGVVTITSISGDTPIKIYFGNFNNSEGGALTVSKTVTPSNNVEWNVTKSVDPASQLNQSGTDATFSYTVNVSYNVVGGYSVSGVITVGNSKSIDVVGLKVVDTIDQSGVCTITPRDSNGTANPDGSVSGLTAPAGGQVLLDYTCTFPSGNPTSGQNHVQLLLSDDTLIAFDDENYAFSVCADVTDTFYGSLGKVCVGDDNPKQFTYTRPVTASPGTCTTVDNTATVTPTAGPALPKSASQSATLCVGADLTVTKTATPSFKRTYNWSISKAVDKTLVEQFGGTATFNYTVKVDQTGFTDSDWAVNGTITVSNPNNWEAVTTNISDAVDNGGACTVYDGATAVTSITVPKSGSKSLTYSCKWASAPSATSGTNTATATWDSGTYFTPNGSASGSASFAFTTPTTTVNKTITVTDSYAGTLGTVTATDAAPWASATFTYSRTVNVPSYDCVSYPNTATITETGQNASQSVKVCGPAKTGALTMGYWQNKNGQTQMQNAGATAGVCNLTPYLRQYAPFQDLAANAPCGLIGSTSSANVVGYVFNIIKAANASGAAMNAMLKGQMLATTLDVYFSTTGLGSKVIDLTKICKNIAGGCTIIENVSGAFGGATSMSVSAMLSYAAGQSNAGGSTWYAQVKATQELAKDAFDAINNEKAFSP